MIGATVLVTVCVAVVYGRAAALAGLDWLLQHRTSDFGWGVDTAKAVLAVSLVDGGALKGAARQLTVKQLQIDLLADLWRHRDYPLPSGRLAEYVLALVSLCFDVRHFQGRDMAAVLQHRVGPMDYECALVVLASCAAGAPARHRSYGRLLGVTDGMAELHGTDTLALAVLALRCVADRNNKHVQRHLQAPLKALVSRQLPDGSFGSYHSTTLAVQALRSERVQTWDELAAVTYLLSRRRPDGSLGGLLDTARVLPVLAGRSLLDATDTDCHRASRAEVTAAGIATGETVNAGMTVATPSEPSENSSFIEVTLWLWIGTSVNDTFTVQLSVPRGTSLFDCMKLAAERDPHFRFSAEVWPNGHYIHTIAGRREEKDGTRFWLLFSLDGPPDPARKPTNKDLHKTGVDSLLPQDGGHVLFWYKDM